MVSHYSTQTTFALADKMFLLSWMNADLFFAIRANEKQVHVSPSGRGGRTGFTSHLEWRGAWMKKYFWYSDLIMHGKC